MEKYLIIILAPLFASIISAFAGRILGNIATATITILCVALSFVLSAETIFEQLFLKYETINVNLYTWLSVGNLSLHIGILIDELTALLMGVVTFISLLVHIYSIGYMKGEKHYKLFFSYISLFTFAMLMLIMSNNFLQLFFGWEAVGLVSYLLIGFYHTKTSAVNASLKAFIVNRVGDCGFILGMALIYTYAGSLDYVQVFASLANIEAYSILNTDLVTVIALLLFLGAMCKSAQFPLHIWLPGSMEGPTPISALIHAATMVTAGIFMVSRLSPLYELSDTALVVIMIIGGITALFMGMIGLVQNDIKKIIAYSTISQLGYMTVALGLSAYHIAIFHLFTHAFFKALLFLGAGSVIIALHHEQDIRKMGGLYRKMPITFTAFVIATLAIIGFPGFAGFYSKELIIEATQYSTLPYAQVIYYALLIGALITTLYSMRLLILVFLGSPRDEKLYKHAKESPLSVTLPLIILALCSIVAGFVMVEPILLGNVFAESIVTYKGVMSGLSSHFDSAIGMMLHAVETKAFYLVISGIVIAWFIFIHKPSLSQMISTRFKIIKVVLSNLYYIDTFVRLVFIRPSINVARIFKLFDSYVIDKILVDGVSSLSKLMGKLLRITQTGYVYHYGFFMIIGLLAMLLWVLISV